MCVLSSPTGCFSVQDVITGRGLYIHTATLIIATITATVFLIRPHRVTALHQSVAAEWCNKTQRAELDFNVRV